jgi:hypothetical protein
VKLEPIFDWVVQVFVAGLVLFVVWKSVQAYRDGRASASWPAVPCVIESSRLDVSEGGGESGAAQYHVDVRYAYEIDGRSYVGDRYAAATAFERKQAEEIVRSLVPGLRTQCFVDPHDPTSAVLARGGHQQVLFLWLFALFLAVGLPLIGIGLVELWDRWQRR